MRFLKCSAAATSIEYCLIAGAVAIAIVTGVALTGTNLNHYYQAVQAATAK